jgi:DNA polymerase-3 subunit beta
VFSVPSRDFIEGARSVVFAAAQTDIKPELSSVFIHMRDDHLVFVATDAFRLAEKKVRIKNLEQFPDILIPAKNLVEILKALPDSKDLITFTITENQFSCTVGGVYITSRLTSGNYPDYRMIIPKESTTECIALRSDLQNLLRTLSVFSDRDSRIDVALHPSEKSCSFSSRNNDIGEAIHSVSCTLKGNDVDIRVNQKHFQDALSNLSVDSAVILCTEPNKPIIIQGVGDISFLYLMMPLSR